MAKKAELEAVDVNGTEVKQEEISKKEKKRFGDLLISAGNKMNSEEEKKKEVLKGIGLLTLGAVAGIFIVNSKGGSKQEISEPVDVDYEERDYDEPEEEESEVEQDEE